MKQFLIFMILQFSITAFIYNADAGPPIAKNNSEMQYNSMAQADIAIANVDAIKKDIKQKGINQLFATGQQTEFITTTEQRGDGYPLQCYNSNTKIRRRTLKIRHTKNKDKRYSQIGYSMSSLYFSS